MNKTVSVCPGKILEEKFLKPMALSLQRVAEDIHISEALIDGIVKGKEVISADTALRLGKYFGNGPEFWLTLQMKHDISVAEKNFREDLAAIPELSESPDVSLKEALNPLTDLQLLEQKKIRDDWLEDKKDHYFMKDAFRLLESADFTHPTDDIAAAAVTVCDMELMKKLTKAGYKRWNKPKVGKNAFSSPCQDIIEFLADNGYDVNTVISSGTSTTTPFCMAVEKGHADIVKYLIETGADVNFKNKQGFTPLHFSADSHSLDTVKALVAAGADINARTIPNRMRDWDPDAMSVLYVMARNGFFEGLKYLIECGADLHHPKEAMTLLHGVCRGSSIVRGKVQETTEYLLDLGFDPFRLDTYQESAAGWAVQNNNIPALRGLISRGVPLNRTRKGGFYNGLRSLEIAALNPDTPEEQLIESLELISAHSVPLANTRALACAVHCARQERAKVCRYLLDKGCRVNAAWKTVPMLCGEDYFSPLHSVCSSENRKRAEVIALLLAAGADVNLKDQNGNTPLAKVFCHPHYEIPEIIALFQQAGADFNAKNNAGRSILQFARNNYASAEVIRLLKAAGAK